MDYKELNQVLENLNRAMYDLEETYMDNGGECTEETDAMEGTIADLQELLNTDGVDLLGRWLKSKEDQKKALKAEKDYLTMEINSIDRTIDFIKGKVLEVMSATGQDKIKGSKGYSFAATMSTTTSVNNGLLMDAFKKPLDTFKKKLPADVQVVLKASVSLADKNNLPIYYVQESKPSCRFGKPRAAKEA